MPAEAASHRQVASFPFSRTRSTHALHAYSAEERRRPEKFVVLLDGLAHQMLKLDSQDDISAIEMKDEAVFISWIVEGSAHYFCDMSGGSLGWVYVIR